MKIKKIRTIVIRKIVITKIIYLVLIREENTSDTCGDYPGQKGVCGEGEESAGQERHEKRCMIKVGRMEKRGNGDLQGTDKSVSPLPFRPTSSFFTETFSLRTWLNRTG